MGERTVRVFSVGIGTDVNTHLLDRLSEQTHAASRYVLPEEDLELALSAFYAKISQPVLASPRLRFQGAVRVTKLAPPLQAQVAELVKKRQAYVETELKKTTAEGKGSAFDVEVARTLKEQAKRKKIAFQAAP